MQRTSTALSIAVFSRSFAAALIALAWLDGARVALGADGAYGSDAASKPTTNQIDKASGQVLTDTNGDTFMEEVPGSLTKQSGQRQGTLVPDLSTVNVPVDPNGHIVPLINKDAGPVLPFYSQFEESVQPLWQFAPANLYGYPAVPYVYQTPNPGYPYYWRTHPYAWSYRFSNRTNFGNFAPWPSNPYPPGLSPVSPWFTPPMIAPPWSPSF